MAGGKRHEDEEKGMERAFFLWGRNQRKPLIITISDRPQAKRELNLILRQTLTTISLSIIIDQIDYSDGWTTSQFWACPLTLSKDHHRESPPI